MKREASRDEPTRLGKCVRKLFRISFSNVGMLIIIFVYLLFGGFLFQFLENKKKVDSRAYFRKHRDECVQELWSITKSSHVLYKQNWTLEALDPLRKFEVNVIREMSSNHKLLFRAWTFTDSLFYSVTILTTIGYNNQTPNTSVGKVATILYATFGIPLMLLFICNMGLMLSDFLQYGCLPKHSLPCSNKCKISANDGTLYEESTLLKKDTIASLNVDSASKNCSNEIRHIVLNRTPRQHRSMENKTRYGTMKFQNECSYCDQCSDFDVNCEWCNQEMHFQIKEQTVVPRATVESESEKKLKYSYTSNFCFATAFTITFVILLTYICIGAFMYSMWKNEPFVDGAYFCFLTLTTIGSCDIFQNLFSSKNETIESLFYGIYIVLGLTLTSAFVLLIQKNVKIEPTCLGVLKFPRIKSADEVAL